MVIGTRIHCVMEHTSATWKFKITLADIYDEESGDQLKNHIMWGGMIAVIWKDL